MVAVDQSHLIKRAIDPSPAQASASEGSDKTEKLRHLSIILI